MSAILGTSVTGAGGGAYSIDNSLRFRSSASALMSRAFGSSGTLTTWTWSAWIKLGALSVQSRFMSCNGTASDRFVRLSDNTIEFTVGGGRLTTTQVFRDPSSWYHVVVVWDTTQATSSNRFKLYINGSQVTALSTATYPAQNNTSSFGATNTWVIGAGSTGALEPFDGYMAEMYYVNNQALTPASFGETNSSTGVWQPKAYAGSYGTNGFYLKFSDIATTSGSNAGLGKDFSGNGNYFNTTNISVTAGVTYDAMKDSPTPASSTVGNFCTANPLDIFSTSVVSNGNLTVNVNGSATGNGGTARLNTINFTNVSGKWYWESFIDNAGTGAATSRTSFCMFPEPVNCSSNPSGYSWFWRADGFTSGLTGAGTFATNDVVMFAYDSDTGKLWLGKNGTWTNSGVPASGTGNNATLTALASYALALNYNTSGGGTGTVSMNYGQRPFSYTPPTGFKAVCTSNLTTPTVGASSTTLASKYFNNILWTGDGSLVNRSITGLGFQPDYVWSKSRSNSAVYHLRQDAVRGANYALDQTTSVEVYRPATGYMASFDSDGFTFNAGASNNINFNQNGSNYVGWCWKANGAGSSNTSGSITSTVSANTTSGFSIVTYTGTGANATVGHGLGAVPKMMIVKARNSAGWLWAVYHASVGNTGYLRLNGTDATTTDSTWQNTTPTSSVFSIGTQGHVNFNASTTYVAYCFAEKTGFSSFGKYTGNGSTDGPFVYTGFKPKFIMIKRTDAADSWYMTDGTRNPYNTVSYGLLAESANSENTGNSGSSPFLDYLSNGFKIRQSSTGMNGSGGTYIYMAFAENPFNYSLAR